MTAQAITFWALSTIAFICAIYTVLAKNPIFSAISLLLCFAAIAGHYLLLNAQFLFIVHIIVYAGAIMVLFLTTLMLMNLNDETEKHKPAISQMAAIAVSIVMGLVLILAVRKIGFIQPVKAPTEGVGMIVNLGKVLLDEYFYPFEFISILLLSAMVGVVLLTKKDKKTEYK
jgi:NADH-quinone oxidoreductase subunit J